MKEKNSKLDYIKIKNICSVKDAIRRMKIPTTGWEKIFAKHKSHKHLL